MTKMDKETILAAVRNDIDAAESYFDSVIKPKLIERYQVYESDKSYYEKLFPKLSKRSSFTSTDVADTIEWAMPSLMRIFFGGEEVITIRGRQAEDDRKAELMQALINFQIQVQNPGFMVFYRWFKDALIGGLGVIKCWWEREHEETIHKTVFSREELDFLQQSPDVDVVAVEDLGNGIYYAVSYKTKKLVKNQPVFTNIPPTEFLYHPDASTIGESTFVAHRKVVTADYLRRRAEEGVYNKEAVEEAIQRGLAENSPYSLDSLEVAIRPNQSKFTFPSTQDEARKYFTLYECYTKLDIDGDGLLEPVIVTVVNDVILRLEENLYGRPPFFVLSPVIEPYEIWGKGFADVIGDIQALKTALIRQILVNVALNNDPKVFVDTTKVNIADLVSDSAFIRVQGGPINAAVFPLPTHPLAPWTYNLLEYLEALKENRTGITRYNQGLDARSLNKTATGIQLIMSAANQRLELIARIFAETGIKEFFRFLIGLNQRFITEDVVIRLTGQELTITPDDLQGYFDLEINAGVGVGIKEQTLQNIHMLLQLYPQLLQMGIATPRNVYNVMKKFVETLGFKNVDDFLTNPEGVSGGGAGIQTAIGGNPEEVSQELAGQGSASSVQGIPGGTQEDLIRALAEQLGGGMAGNQGEAGGAG